MSADPALSLKIVDYRTIVGTGQAFLIFHVALETGFACDMLASDLVRLSVDDVEWTVTKETFEVRDLARSQGLVPGRDHWRLLLLSN